jgi:hypothetical protein
MPALAVAVVVAGMAAASPSAAGWGPDAPVPLRVKQVIELTDGSVEYRLPVWSPNGARVVEGLQGPQDVGRGRQRRDQNGIPPQGDAGVPLPSV